MISQREFRYLKMPHYLGKLCVHAKSKPPQALEAMQSITTIIYFNNSSTFDVAIIFIIIIRTVSQENSLCGSECILTARTLTTQINCELPLTIILTCDLANKVGQEGWTK